MKKKLLMALVLIVGIISGLFSQEIKRLTFVERKSDGTIVGTVTVNAIFMGWSQQRISYEGNLQVTREAVFLINMTEWSDWQIMERSPTRNLTLRQLYDIFLEEYNRNPRSSIRLYDQSGLQSVRIMTIRSGGSSPMWWSEDGRSFNILYENWAIIP